MNHVLRYSLSAIFTSLATSYFLGVGIYRLAQTPPVHSPLPLPLSNGDGSSWHGNCKRTNCQG